MSVIALTIWAVKRPLGLAITPVRPGRRRACWPPLGSTVQVPGEEGSPRSMGNASWRTRRSAASIFESSNLVCILTLADG